MTKIKLIFFILAFTHLVERTQAGIVSTERPHFIDISLAIWSLLKPELNRLFVHNGSEDLILKLAAETREGRPTYWPEDTEWPLEKGVSIVSTYETYPPVYKLSNGKTVDGCITERAEEYNREMDELIAQETQDTAEHINTIKSYIQEHHPSIFTYAQDGKLIKMDTKKIETMRNTGTLLIIPGESLERVADCQNTLNSNQEFPAVSEQEQEQQPPEYTLFDPRETPPTYNEAMSNGN